MDPDRSGWPAVPSGSSGHLGRTPRGQALRKAGLSSRVSRPRSRRLREEPRVLRRRSDGHSRGLPPLRGMHATRVRGLEEVYWLSFQPSAWNSLKTTALTMCSRRDRPAWGHRTPCRRAREAETASARDLLVVPSALRIPASWRTPICAIATRFCDDSFAKLPVLLLVEDEHEQADSAPAESIQAFDGFSEHGVIEPLWIVLIR